ncbi:unnamed protein product [Hymenolepis diminuta]|uniref:Uncharacterized protein n=1 Tax=Hymenolepis diminuta TaxID=6216 RepID=A0A0R3SMU7_HYMDI|nr:unnamed protein product [Hymenolepis diminuta]
MNFLSVLTQTRANPRGASPSVWQLRDSSSNETPSAFTDLRKPPPPPPPLATVTVSNNAGTPTTTISTNTPSTSINPTVPLKINTPLASLVGHPAPPPPPKRSPQTVLTG